LLAVTAGAWLSLHNGYLIVTDIHFSTLWLVHFNLFTVHTGLITVDCYLHPSTASQQAYCYLVWTEIQQQFVRHWGEEG